MGLSAVSTNPGPDAAGLAAGTEMEVPVDLAHLRRYTLGDDGLEREILGLFLAQIPLTIETLRFAPNDKAWHAAAHTLKGSARAVGAWRLARLAQEAERLGGPGEPGACHEALARIEEAAEDAAAFIAARCTLTAV